MASHMMKMAPSLSCCKFLIGNKVATLAQELLDNLSGNQIVDFNAFRAEYLGIYMEEFTHKQLISEQQSTT